MAGYTPLFCMLGKKKTSRDERNELEALRAEVSTLREQVAALQRTSGTGNIAEMCSIRPGRPLAPPLGQVTELPQKTSQIEHFQGIREAIDVAACQKRDTLPVPALEDREYYFPKQDLDYWMSGLRDYYRIRQELADEGAPLADGQRIFDFGAASGRVLRHFMAQHGALRLASADVNENHVAWIAKHLGPAVDVFQCTNIPTLPIEDNAYDVVYAFSVFTHMDEWETTWLAELRRILKPGGYAYFSVQTEDTWALLNPDHFLYQHLRHNQGKMPEWTITPELFSTPMPSEKVVFRFNDTTVYNTCTFQSKAYVQEVWSRFFTIKRILHCGHDFQDVVLMQKPA